MRRTSAVGKVLNEFSWMTGFSCSSACVQDQSMSYVQDLRELHFSEDTAATPLQKQRAGRPVKWVRSHISPARARCVCAGFSDEPQQIWVWSTAYIHPCIMMLIIRPSSVESLRNINVNYCERKTYCTKSSVCVKIGHTKRFCRQSKGKSGQGATNDDVTLWM